jgi:hypothetical protein
MRSSHLPCPAPLATACTQRSGVEAACTRLQGRIRDGPGHHVASVNHERTTGCSGADHSPGRESSAVGRGSAPIGYSFEHTSASRPPRQAVGYAERRRPATVPHSHWPARQHPRTSASAERESCQRPDRCSIGLYHVHRPDHSTDIEETLSVLGDLVCQGKSGPSAARRSPPRRSWRRITSPSAAASSASGPSSRPSAISPCCFPGLSPIDPVTTCALRPELPRVDLGRAAERQPHTAAGALRA